MTTQRQIEANRKNGLKGGPRTKAGKAVTRLNARKHGIFDSALTEFDNKESRGIRDELAEWIKPEGPAERMLTEMIALNYLRLQRCARAEAEYHIGTWEPRIDEYEVRRQQMRQKEGRHASWFSESKFTRSVEMFGRYNTSLTNQTVKLLHELERLQRMRRREGMPPPIATGVTVTPEETAPPAMDGTDGVRDTTNARELPIIELRNEPNVSHTVTP